MNHSPIRRPLSSRSLLVAVGAACIALTSSLALSDTRLPQGIPQSCGIQLKGHNFTVQTLDRVHALGFRVVRRGLYWDSVEKEKGVYDFSQTDEPMRHAGKLGLTVVGVLFGGNKLYEDPSQGGIQTEAGRAGFANFAAAAARQYQDQHVLWEIWNEPNVRTFWRKSGMHNSEEFATEYTALVQAVAPAMLKADPACFVAAGSVSNYWEPSYSWTEQCFKKGILASGIRGWSVHPYGVSTPEEFAAGHARMRELLKKYKAAEMPLLDTERGFAVKQSAEGWSGGAAERAREFQAWSLVRQYLVDQLCGVRVTVWYEWDGPEFGLADEGGDRPALKAFQVMAAQLGGYRFARRLESDSPRDYLLLFENEAGQRKLAAWTAPPPGGSPEEARQHVVAVETDRSFAVTRLNGEPQKLAGGIPLTLSGAPQYVELPADMKLLGSRTLQVTGSAKPAGVAAAGPSPDKLLTAGEWKFMKNTGDGSFELAKGDDGEPIGVLSYDFSKSKSKSTPYVLAVAAVNIPEARQLQLAVRSQIAQPLTFRVTDATGQTHQFKTRIQGSGKWETIRIPLAARLEHWDGANDGKIHFPVTSLTFSVPSPGDTKQGKVEYSRIAAGGGEE